MCTGKLDLAFLIDGSGSVGRSNFRRCLTFIQNVVRGFRISPRYTRVAAEVYSSTPRRIFTFTQSKNAYQVLRAIGSIRYPMGGTKTGKALWDVLRYMFRGRTNRKRVLLVLTDGRSQDHVLKPARALKRANAEIFSVGVGRGYSMKQLSEMATDRSHVFTVDFRNLNSIIKAIKMKACKGKCAVNADVVTLHTVHWFASRKNRLWHLKSVKVKTIPNFRLQRRKIVGFVL